MLLAPRHIHHHRRLQRHRRGLATAIRYAGIRLSLHGRNEARLANVAEGAKSRGATATAKAGDVVLKKAWPPG